MLDPGPDPGFIAAMTFLDRIPLSSLLLVVALLGLAPFFPEPHVWEKLRMLAAGQLSRGIDIFDLALHGTPWLVLLAKLARLGLARRSPDA